MDWRHVRSGQRVYHVRALGVTWRGDEGTGRLVICLPWIKPEFGSQYGGPLESPEGWPQLPQPVPGETLATYSGHAIDGDPFLLKITPLTSDRRPVPSLAECRPADLTLAWWERRWPSKVFDRREDDSPPRGYHRDRVYWRLVVELLDRLRVGDFVMKARRMDDPESPFEPVKRGLFQNPFMVLRPHAPHGGWFRAEQWHGSEPPDSLPWYREVTLWPRPATAAETSETKRETTRAVGRPGVRETCIEMFEARRSRGLPLEPQIAEAVAIVAAWPDDGPPKPLPRTVSGHISKEYRQAKDAADQDRQNQER